MKSRSIAVLGLSHLGSVLTACWASLGHRVHAVDVRPGVIERVRGGRLEIFEPGLDDLFATNVRAGRIVLGSDVAVGTADADVVFVALDTPVDDDDQANITPVEEIARRVWPAVRDGAVVIVSSQVPVGTCGRWRAELRQHGRRSEVDLVYSPENLRLGEALRCCLHPDRIVVGSDDDRTRRYLDDFFAPMAAPLVHMSIASAEMTKHALNGFLATSISFINEIATLCEQCGADVLDVVGALKSDVRIGPGAALNPGLGFAGGTLGREVQALRRLASEHGFTAPLLTAVKDVNAGRAAAVIDRLKRTIGSLDGAVIGILGVTYKAGTSTLQRSIALKVVGALIGAGATVKVFDPRADFSAIRQALEFEIAPDAYAAASGAHALMVLTDWPEFTVLDFDRIKATMARPVVVDGRNVLAALRLADRGLTYVGLGR